MSDAKNWEEVAKQEYRRGQKYKQQRNELEEENIKLKDCVGGATRTESEHSRKRTMPTKGQKKRWFWSCCFDSWVVALEFDVCWYVKDKWTQALADKRKSEEVGVTVGIPGQQDN